MKSSIKIKVIFFLLLSLNGLVPVFAQNRMTFSTGATYITGDYGNPDKTEIYYVPFTFKYKYEKIRFKLTIPYLEKTGPNNVIKDIGQIRQQVNSQQTTETGLGDITAAIKYNAYYHQDLKFLVDTEAKVIIGTADASKGLGTGKTDFSFRLGFYKVFDHLTPYTKVGYKVYGSQSLNNVFFVSSGFSYQLNKIISAGIDYSWREKVSNFGVQKHQVTAFSSQKLTKNWGFQEYVIKGFGRSTADWGGGIAISYRFNF